MLLTNKLNSKSTEFHAVHVHGGQRSFKELWAVSGVTPYNTLVLFTSREFVVCTYTVYIHQSPSQRPSPLRPRDHTSSEQEDTITPEDREDFMQRYTSFLESKGTPLSRPAMVGQKELDLHRLYKMVNEIGGMDRVTQEMKWRSIYLRLGMPPTTTASYAISRAYKKWVTYLSTFCTIIHYNYDD